MRKRLLFCSRLRRPLIIRNKFCKAMCSVQSMLFIFHIPTPNNFMKCTNEVKSIHFPLSIYPLNFTDIQKTEKIVYFAFICNNSDAEVADRAAVGQMASCPILTNCILCQYIRRIATQQTDRLHQRTLTLFDNRQYYCYCPMATFSIPLI